MSSFEANNATSFEDLSINDYNYSILNKDGEIVSDKRFGTLATSPQSLSFMKALSGKSFFNISKVEGVERLECWSLIKYKNEPHVLVLRKSVSDSKLSYFFSSFIIFAIISIFLLLFSGTLIASPFHDSLTYLDSDLKDMKSEKFDKKQASLDTCEFTQLYDSYNNLGTYIQSEFGALRSDLKQWEVFFTTMPRGLIAIDSQRTIHNCNLNSLQLLDIKGKSSSDVTGQSIMAVFRNADMNRITSEFLESGKDLEEYEFELVANNIIETIKVICVQLELHEEEETKGAIVIIENITALRRLENMRKDFVSNVSHELKTPISIISGFVETIKECKDDQESIFRFIDIIENNTARLSLIIDDLLNLSKLEQNEAVMRKDFESKNISETVQIVTSLCSHEAKKKKISLELELEDSKYYGEGAMLANHRLIEQALRNLIENAIRYSPEGTAVTISSRKIKEEIEISVIDSGPGIALEHQDKIFGRFYRVDKSRDRQTGGSGLGLSIVKHIARIHNGHVRLESEEGEGATFTLVLPYITK